MNEKKAFVDVAHGASSVVTFSLPPTVDKN
jgi:hypothetical protein